jgi:hypothetical protein
MGLTKEVRNFFTGRINRLLDTKLQAIKSKIDKKKVTNQSVSKLFAGIKLSPALLSRYEQIKEQQELLSKEQQDIKTLICDGVQKEYPKSGIYRYANDFVEEVERVAEREFGQEIVGELYPELVPQIEQIERIKEDVESVVLLSTSETKLVGRLTEVLKKYGGDIQELLDFIPE